MNIDSKQLLARLNVNFALLRNPFRPRTHDAAAWNRAKAAAKLAALKSVAEATPK